MNNNYYSWSQMLAMQAEQRLGSMQGTRVDKFCASSEAHAYLQDRQKEGAGLLICGQVYDARLPGHKKLILIEFRA